MNISLFFPAEFKLSVHRFCVHSCALTPLRPPSHRPCKRIDDIIIYDVAVTSPSEEGLAKARSGWYSAKTARTFNRDKIPPCLICYSLIYIRTIFFEIWGDLFFISWKYMCEYICNCKNDNVKIIGAHHPLYISTQ